MIPHLLAQMTLEDVFRSTQQSMSEAPSSGRLLALVLGGAALLLLLLVLQMRLRREAVAKPINHHGRLLKEARKKLRLRAGELRQLKVLADRQSCSSPLTLLICPSVLAKAREAASKSEQQGVDRLVRRLEEKPQTRQAA